METKTPDVIGCIVSRLSQWIYMMLSSLMFKLQSTLNGYEK